MLKRYTKNSKGNLVKQADVYLLEEHGITRDKIDKDALRICERLNARGFEAYIVGGAIRDLLLGLSPKDFDIVTNADPKQTKKACGHARIIGRRFPLVHAVSPGGRIFEVATFRSLQPDEEGNIFGTIYEDAFRRDFTINALYYNPENGHLIDFHQAFMHIKKLKLIPIIPPVQSFVEDPVRMLRAVKYSVTTGSHISLTLGIHVKKYARFLQTCSRSRLTEELNKVLRNDKVFDILLACHQYELFEYWLPELAQDLTQLPKNYQMAFWHDLKHKHDGGQRYTPEEVLQYLFEDYLERRGVLKDGHLGETVQTLKDGLLPLVLPNIQVYQVVQNIFSEHKLHPEMPDFVATDGTNNKRRRRRPCRKVQGHHQCKIVP